MELREEGLNSAPKPLKKFSCLIVYTLITASSFSCLPANRTELARNSPQDILEPNEGNPPNEPPESSESKSLSLTGAVSEVTLATPQTVDNGTIAQIDVIIKRPDGRWVRRIFGTGLFAYNRILTAAHVIEKINGLVRYQDSRGNRTMVVARLPYLPNANTLAYQLNRAITPVRPSCVNGQGAQYENDVGAMSFFNTVREREIQSAISNLAGTPTQTRDPPFSTRSVWQTSLTHFQANYYGRINNGIYQHNKLFKSAPGSTIMSGACSTGGPCFYVTAGSQSNPGDSGGPLWVAGYGWVGFLVGTGPAPYTNVNYLVNGCELASRPLDPNRITTYFAKNSFNALFFASVRAATPQWWLDATNGLIPSVTGFRLLSNVAPNTAVPLSGVSTDAVDITSIPFDTSTIAEESQFLLK